MSKSILQQLYDGEIYPAESIALKEPHQMDIKSKLYDETMYFQSLLSSEDWKRFEKRDDLLSALSSEHQYAVFTCGFRLAVKMIVEGLSNGEKIALSTK